MTRAELILISVRVLAKSPLDYTAAECLKLAEELADEIIKNQPYEDGWLPSEGY